MNPADDQAIYQTVMVTNTDIGCADTSEDIVKVSNRVVDSEGAVATEIYDKHEQWKHDDFFQVKFDGKPYRIAPGKTALLPRFIADHFAKHLADHLLQKKEDATKRHGLVQSSVERPKVLSQILVEVNNDVITTTPEAATSPEPPVVDADPVVDGGAVPPTAEGNLQPEPPTLQEVLKLAGEDPEKVDRIPLEDTSLVDEKKPLPTRKQLIELCYQQHIDFSPDDTKAILIEKLKQG